MFTTFIVLRSSGYLLYSTPSRAFQYADILVQKVGSRFCCSSIRKLSVASILTHQRRNSFQAIDNNYTCKCVLILLSSRTTIFCTCQSSRKQYQSAVKVFGRLNPLVVQQQTPGVQNLMYNCRESGQSSILDMCYRCFQLIIVKVLVTTAHNKDMVVHLLSFG